MPVLILTFLIIFPSSTSSQERLIPKDCEILEGWVTVWIDQIRRVRANINSIESEDQELSLELQQKYEYLEYEYGRFSKVFDRYCDNQGFQDYKPR